MTFSVTIPTLGKPKNVKEVIINILSIRWPLTALQIFNNVKKTGLNISYQSVHKAINELVNDELIIRKDTVNIFSGCG